MLPFKFSDEEIADETLIAAIDYTISQDFAAGHSAEQGRRLQGFHGEGNSNESSSRPPFDPSLTRRLSHLTPGSEALKDYQMQLMLLEQQNKKRLLMARQEQAESEESAQQQAEQLDLVRKRPRLDATANDMEENLASTSATTGQVTNGLDQASNYEVLSLGKISTQQTDVCRRSLATFEFSIRSIAIALTNVDTTAQIFSRTRHSQTFHLMVARRRKIRGRQLNLLARFTSGDGLPSMILKITWKKTRILRSLCYDVANVPAGPQSETKKYTSSQVPCDLLYTLLLDATSANCLRISILTRQHPISLLH